MIRVTNNYMTNNLMRTLNGQNQKLDHLQRQISSQNKIQAPHEDPEGTALAMLYRNKIVEFNRYEKNIEDGVAHLNLLDAKLQEVSVYLQNIREEAVKGANGPLTKSDREKIAVQVEQYLSQIVNVANSDFKGDSLFAGYKTDSRPYQVSYDKSANWSSPLISKVAYDKGDNGSQYREIGAGEYVPVNISGNKVFWGSEQRIASQTKSTGYMALSSNSQRPYQTIKIDGMAIQIDDGDNLNTIVDKINNAPIAVKAQIDNTTGNDFIVLQSTKPHQIWLSDEAGGTVLQDIGLISEGGPYPPGNYAPSAIVYGKNLFDEIIDLRNALISDNVNGINRSIGNIDTAMDNVRTSMAEVGSLQSRLDIAQERMSKSVVYANDIYSKVQGTQMIEAITDMKNLDFAHKAALQITSRIIRPTLLDFLR